MIHINRITSPEHLKIVAGLAQRIWPVSYANILTSDQINNMLDRIYNIENLRSEMQSGHHFFISTLNSQPVGYVAGYQEDNVLWLKKLYVLPEMQGYGIGKQLVDALVENFPFSQEIRLLVNRNNLHAQQFYLSQHFIQTDELPVQMGDFKFVDMVFSKQL